MVFGRLRDRFFRKQPQQSRPLPIVTPAPKQSLLNTGGVVAAGEPSHDRAPGSISDDVGHEDEERSEVVTSFVKRIQNSRSRPTEPELVAYAEYLGVDPSANGDLMWIVDQSLLAPLPPEWLLHQDSEGRLWYHNQLTRSNTWTHPLDALHKDVYQAIVRFRESGLSPREQKLELARRRVKLQELERAIQQEGQAWSDRVNVNGQRFFFNRARNWSSRTDPWSAPRHELALHTQALQLLKEWTGREQVKALPPSFNEQLALADVKKEPRAAAAVTERTDSYHLLVESIAAGEPEGDSPRTQRGPSAASQAAAPPAEAFAWYS